MPFRRIRGKLQSRNWLAQRAIHRLHLKSQVLLVPPAPQHPQALNHRTADLTRRRDRIRVLPSHAQENCLKSVYLTRPKPDTYSVEGTSRKAHTSHLPHNCLDQMEPAFRRNLNTSGTASSVASINMKGTARCRISNDSSRLAVRIRRRNETSHLRLR